MPRVKRPVRWSCFMTTSTVSPSLTSLRSLPSIIHRLRLLASRAGPSRDSTFSRASTGAAVGRDSSPPPGASSASRSPPPLENGAQPRQMRTSGSPEAGSASLVKSSPSRIRPPHREHDSSRSARYSAALVPVSSSVSPALSLCGLPRFTFPTCFMVSPRRPLVSPASFLVVAEEVDGVLVQVLPPVVVAHHGLRVSMLRHHLHLPVAEPRL